VSRDLATVLLSALAAMVNPSLLAAVTVMLLLPHPRRLMLGYLLGAYTTSIVFGLAFVFSLHGSSAVGTSKHTLSPGEDVVAGVVAVTIAMVVATGHDASLRRWRAQRREAKSRAGKTESWQQRMLGKGSARLTFVVGAALSFPGVTYLNALSHIVKLNPGTVPSVLLVIYFCVMQQILLELPLLGYLVAPDWTQGAVTRTRDWLHRKGRTLMAIGLGAIGVYLLIHGLSTFSG